MTGLGFPNIGCLQFASSPPPIPDVIFHCESKNGLNGTRRRGPEPSGQCVRIYLGAMLCLDDRRGGSNVLSGTADEEFVVG